LHVDHLALGGELHQATSVVAVARPFLRVAQGARIDQQAVGGKELRLHPDGLARLANALGLVDPEKTRGFGCSTKWADKRADAERSLAKWDREPVTLDKIDEAGVKKLAANDEPDNAQPLGKGYGPPVLPAKIVEDYKRFRKADPSRPVLLNLGQGVAWDRYAGRGTRTNHPEDYPEYVKGCDIASFDIYPACHEHREVAGKQC
jgi:hypothetical protein